jgi:hypothetical protein
MTDKEHKSNTSHDKQYEGSQPPSDSGPAPDNDGRPSHEGPAPDNTQPPSDAGPAPDQLEEDAE